MFEALARDKQTQKWQGLGIVIQAYGKRAPYVIEWVATLARETGRRICVRLVKGAYWDAEVKRAQERGLTSYPVFTRKVSTDISYLACAERLFKHRDVIYPMFATHNAHTIAAVLELRPPGAKFEFQRLHGMGALLHAEAKRQIEGFPRVRAYAPVGPHEDLLSYLVRRLLENGANSSFVNRFMNESVPVDTVVEDPIAALQAADSMTNPHIPLPNNLYGASRENSAGVDWGNPQQLAEQIASLQKSGELPRAVPSTLAGGAQAPQEVRNPANLAELVGYVSVGTKEDIALAFDKAGAGAQGVG